MKMIATEKKTIVIVAGEPSGDKLAGGVVHSLQTTFGARFSFMGIGGSHMVQAGVKLVADISKFASFGVKESGLNAVRWMNAYAELRLRVRDVNVGAVLLVDCPEINLRFARAFKAEGIPVLWFVGPKVWAFRKGRLKLLRERTDMVALTFPFEPAIYEQAGVPCRFVGHPFADSLPDFDPLCFRQLMHCGDTTPMVALLPGSRKSEINQHLQIMLDASALMIAQGWRPVIAPHPDTVTDEIVGRIHQSGAVLYKGDDIYELLAAADCAVVASGTATLEAAIAGTPMVIVYRLDAISGQLARRFVKIPYAGLPNWILGEKRVPELLEAAFTVPNVLSTCAQLLVPAIADRQRRDLQEVTRLIRKNDVYGRVAACLTEIL